MKGDVENLINISSKAPEERILNLGVYCERKPGGLFRFAI